MSGAPLSDELHKLKDLYSEALSLEEDLHQLINSNSLSGFNANTRKKKQLMTRIDAQFATVQQLLSNSADAETLSELRAETADLLERIIHLEDKNRKSIHEKQVTQATEIKQNQSARRFARGYKPSRESHPSSKLDEKG